MIEIEEVEGKDPNRVGPLPLCEGVSLYYVSENNKGYPWEISFEITGLDEKIEEAGLDPKKISMCARLNTENFTELAGTLSVIIRDKDFKKFLKNETAED